MIMPIYRSQWAPGATTRINDCGQTCGAMFFAALGIALTIDSLRVGDPTGLTSAQDLVNMFTAHGVQSHIEKPPGLDAAKPNSILLINYAPIARYAQDKGFSGWHWLIYLGNDGQNATVLDPDYWGSRINEGDHKVYPLVALKAAFRAYSGDGLATAVVVDGIIVQEPIMAQTMYVNHLPGLNVRETPAGAAIGSFNHADMVAALDYHEDAVLAKDKTNYTWRAVVMPNKKLGYVAEKYLSVNPPPV